MVEEVGGEAATIEADVCVVGSGAGGGVIAAELQRAGRSVVVLEQGVYQNESDFKQLELPGSLELYLGGGLITSPGHDGRAGPQAGNLTAWPARGPEIQQHGRPAGRSRCTSPRG